MSEKEWDEKTVEEKVENINERVSVLEGKPIKGKLLGLNKRELVFLGVVVIVVILTVLFGGF